MWPPRHGTAGAVNGAGCHHAYRYCTPTLSLTATQLTADATTLAKITGAYNLAVSAVLAANAATVATNTLVTSITVADTAANVTINIAALQTLAASGELQLITLTNSGTTALSFTAAQATANVAALSLLSGSFTLAVSDTAANVVANITTLETLALGGDLTSIILTDTSTPTLSLTVDQVADNVNALADITSAYHLTVADSALDVSADIDALQALSTKLTSITLTDSGTPALTITGTQLTNDATALSKITSAYNMTVSGVTAANAAIAAANTHVTSLSIADSAANVANNIAALETLATGGKLTSIVLTDTGTPTLTLTSAQETADAAALALITTPYTLITATSNAPITAAAAAALVGKSGVSNVLVSDTAANVITNLAALQTLGLQVSLPLLP